MSSHFLREKIVHESGKIIDLAEAIANGFQLIDVRSPEEFLQGSIPDAINVALFDDIERSVIGTIYRHGGHEQAVSKGFEYVEEKLSNLIQSFSVYKDKPLAIYCARGGLRSLSIVNLLHSHGYDARQIRGGYKAYRHETLARLEHFSPRLIVLHGLTGTGKTRIIDCLDNSIDLEDLAGHRSSIFGALGQIPCNQKTFESRLVQTLSTLTEQPYFIEGESRKIGEVYIPKPLAQAMKKGCLVSVESSMDTRIRRIIEDYPVHDDESVNKIATILHSLQQRLGKAAVDKMCKLLRNGDLNELVQILLVDYYDKRYKRSMRRYTYDLVVSSEDIDVAAVQLTRFRDTLLKQ